MEYKLIVTKTLGAREHRDHLHLNLICINHVQPEEEERRNRYEAILGYSRRLGTITLLSPTSCAQKQLSRQNSNALCATRRRWRS